MKAIRMRELKMVTDRVTNVVGAPIIQIIPWRVRLDRVKQWGGP
jgi:hypothetical protein